MNLPFGLTSEQVTFAFILALAAFFLYLQLKRFARLSSERQMPQVLIEHSPEADQGGDPEEPVTVARFGTFAEAEMWAGILCAEDIDAKAIGGRTSSRSGIPRVQVRRKDAPRAIEILREANSTEHLSEDEEPPQPLQ